MAERSGLREPSQRLEALGLLAALAGVRLAADGVHGNRQRGVRLAADGAKGHGAGGEALDDLAGGLDLVERNRLLAQLIGKFLMRNIPRKVSSSLSC
jgi:hypothetical protein